MKSFIDWLKNPLQTESGSPSAWRLFLFIGLVIVLIAVWGVIFSHIRENIE